MNIIILSPAVFDIKLTKKLLYNGGIMFLTNPVLQNHYINKMNYPEFIFKTNGDFIDPDAAESIDNKALYFTYNWYLEDAVSKALTFDGINLGGLFVAEMKYFFIGIIKAFVICENLFNSHKNDSFYLLDDNGNWTKACKYLAVKKNICLKIIPYKKQEIRQGNILNLAKNVYKNIYSRINPPGSNNNAGIIYSSALKYAEPIWRSIKTGEEKYYLRPVFSYKAFHIAKDNPDMKLTHIIPEYYNNAHKKINLQHIVDTLDAYFSKTAFFNYRGYNLWDIIKPELYAILRRNANQCIKWISSFYNIIDNLKPSCIIVDEDHCHFNQALVKCAEHKKIKSYQLLHGLIGHSNAIKFVNSTKILVFGESSKNRLIESGTSPDKIGIIGSPSYEKALAGTNRLNSKQGFISKFKLDKKIKIITLVTQPFRSEENPDYLNTYVTAENIAKMIHISAKAIMPLKDVKLVIKLHPADNYAWFTEKILKEENCQDKTIVIRNYNTWDILASSDILLVSGSTVYLEALLLKIPILIFDDSKKRFLEFMSDFFLDLSGEKKSVDTIKDFINNESLRKARLEQQEQELSRHFHNKNAGATKNFEKLVYGN